MNWFTKLKEEYKEARANLAKANLARYYAHDAYTKANFWGKSKTKANLAKANADWAEAKFTRDFAADALADHITAEEETKR